MTAEALIEAIVVMIKKQDAEIQEEEKNKEKGPKPEDFGVPKNSLKRKATLIQNNFYATATKEEIRDDLFVFFEKHQKTFYASSGA